MSETARRGGRFSRTSLVLAAAAVLLLAAAAVTGIALLADGDDGGGQAEAGDWTAAEGNGPGASGGGEYRPGESRSAPGGSPLNDATPPPLPAGEPATHQGRARLTTMVSGQTFSVDVGITVRLDGGTFLFAYAGTGTVPVNIGPGVAATADYAITGDFTGSIDGETFTGTGPATVQASVTVPGMGPQNGGSTQQLVIRGVIREAEGGRLEGEFVGGSYAGTFWAGPV